jgi:hypothetical protein
VQKKIGVYRLKLLFYLKNFNQKTGSDFKIYFIPHKAKRRKCNLTKTIRKAFLMLTIVAFFGVLGINKQNVNAQTPYQASTLPITGQWGIESILIVLIMRHGGINLLWHRMEF